MPQLKQYDPSRAVSLLQTIAANVDNFSLSDEAFRMFVRNSLPVAEQKYDCESYRHPNQR